MFEELSLKEYNDLLGSKAPAPGGGSALAQVAAMACSLIEMAINVTTAKMSPENANFAYLITQRDFVLRAKKGLYKLSNDDAAAFQRIVNGLGMPKQTEQEAKTRASELQKAYHKAALIPLDVMGLCRECIRICNVRILPLLNKYVSSDCVIAVDLLRSVARNSMLNVRANTALIVDSTLAASLNRQGEQILSEL